MVLLMKSLTILYNLPTLQVGKGLSKNGKAQKLAFQHWLEAVSKPIHYVTFSLCVDTVELYTDLIILVLSRLIHDIGMGTIYISIMLNG